MNDDPGVLGRLPRSRPGTRSEKRVADAPARAAKASEQRPTRASKPAKAAPPPKPARPAKAARKAKAGPEPKSAPPPKPARPPRVDPPSHSAPPKPRQPDPLTDAVRAGVRVAEGGLKLAGGITRELLRRVPRP